VCGLRDQTLTLLVRPTRRTAVCPRCRWIRAGELKVLNVGSQVRPDYRIRRPDLDEFINRRYGAVGKDKAAA
jgi:hypothetical protein